MCDKEICAADSTTWPFESPARSPSPSAWSIDTLDLNVAEEGDMEPDSTTSDGEETPDGLERLSPSLLDDDFLHDVLDDDDRDLEIAVEMARRELADQELQEAFRNLLEMAVQRDLDLANGGAMRALNL